ncbi:MAG TPA: patatin-like phospholipase family protein, partial [Chloroflexia bacterium]
MDDTRGPVALVLGGGGILGASEVGMLRALLDAGVRPDIVVGTSVGAINGALLA